MIPMRFAILLFVVVSVSGCSGGKSDDTDGAGKISPEMAAENARINANMKTIGLAMHKYNATHGRLPANDSNGYAKSDKERKAGLSWRVYLLPFLGENALFNQFKHDEPWDGPNNKQLIARIPDVFKTPESEEGKTSIQVFVGDGVKSSEEPPFSRNYEGVTVGPRFRDIKDGARNTLMAVVAGPEKSDVWTKPGGLPFHPEKNPLEAMGTIPGDGFFVVFFDGSVGEIKTSIRPEQTKLLIQPRDGQPIGEIPGIRR